MKSRKLLKILSIICVCTIVAAPTNFVTLANDGESTTAPSGQESTVTVEEAQKNLEQQRAELEKKLSENEAKLETFEESAKTTAEYIDTIMTRITFPGSLFIAFIAVMPALAGLLNVQQGFSQFFGGTSLLILVGVVIDTLQQIESHLLMRHYDGLLNSGHTRGGAVSAY